MPHNRFNVFYSKAKAQSTSATAATALAVLSALSAFSRDPGGGVEHQHVRFLSEGFWPNYKISLGGAMRRHRLFSVGQLTRPITYTFTCV